MSSFLLNADQWVNLYADPLYSYILPRVNDAALAEDLVQETFLSAWKARNTYRGEASEKSWLFTICKNKIIDHYRKKAKSIMQPVPDAADTDRFFDDTGHWTAEDKPSEWGTDYQHTIENKEFYSILESCKRKLQQLQQDVFAMKYLEDLEAAEICKVLGITTSNYWVLIHRAKLQLRNCLEKNWINIR
jgi:RNA polymerase sigma-70 factor (TIGR02943 family)